MERHGVFPSNGPHLNVRKATLRFPVRAAKSSNGSRRSFQRKGDTQIAAILQDAPSSVLRADFGGRQSGNGRRAGLQIGHGVLATERRPIDDATTGRKHVLLDASSIICS
jgi:hypothetical protein